MKTYTTNTYMAGINNKHLNNSNIDEEGGVGSIAEKVI